MPSTVWGERKGGTTNRGVVFHFTFLLYVCSKADQFHATPLLLGLRQQQSLLQLRGEAFSLSFRIEAFFFTLFFLAFSEQLKQQQYIMKL